MTMMYSVMFQVPPPPLHHLPEPLALSICPHPPSRSLNKHNSRDLMSISRLSVQVCQAFLLLSPSSTSSYKSDIVVRWILVVITIIGFVVLDIAYTAVVVNYCIQCQLLVYLIRSICERIKTKDWEIDQSIRVKIVTNTCTCILKVFY